MSAVIVNVLGNGETAGLFKRGAPGKLLICNMPPFDIPANEVHATCMVDYKMMHALTQGHIQLDMYDWVLGNRPRDWMDKRPDFYMRYSRCIREFYRKVPEYAGNATNFSCGHMAVHYAIDRMGAGEVRMWGFDVIFDMNANSFTDLLLESDRGMNNTHRLVNVWRKLWKHTFLEYEGVDFKIHHSHDKVKIPIPPNVEIIVDNSGRA